MAYEGLAQVAFGHIAAEEEAVAQVSCAIDDPDDCEMCGS